MADALEDDYIQSDGEQIDAGSDVGYDSESGEAGPSSTRSRQEENGNKQKRRIEQTEVDEEENRNKKKQKMKKRDQIKKQKKAAANMALQPGALAKYPVEMQADHLRQLMRSCKQFSKWTEMELDEMGVAQSMLIDTSGLDIKREADTLAQFILKAMPKVTEAIKSVKDEGVCGQPSVLVISGNAQRAADLSRSLRSLNPSSDSNGKEKNNGKSKGKVAVAKLFARHFKIDEQKAFLEASICPLAVGTPQRLQDLLTNGLDLQKLRCIIIDATWTDQKQRTMLDTIETRQALFSMLACPEFQARLHGKSSSDTKSNKKEEKIKSAANRAKIVLF
ncbi:uncharacterized protein FA14DRAFT_190969 [Meira miltonrushii]|uniref:P-loop containing nucleoside triphosphate hydrolase protein n=1 Tax=Meira miltonrushii TaxID=1280837 RepID=A0A316V8M3_9BASI|nr:uncharacterized protein FA14DRAFT_190969 [Meira miltonrushii]PWN33856.1 hypothetical protein FA14DRAFT_190969 [Meira miltonrushii]